MRRLPFSLISTCLLATLAAPVGAQVAPPGAEPLSAPAEPEAVQAAAPAGAAVSAADTAAVAALPGPVVAPQGQQLCVLEFYPERARDTSITIARMTCDELRKSGIAVTQPLVDAEYAGRAYIIRLERLGETMLLAVREESAAGATLRSQTIGLGRPEEAKQAIPRVVDALLSGKHLDDTRSFDTVTGDEVRKRKQLSGEWITGLGIVAVSAPLNDPAVGAAVEFFGYYETSGWGLGLGFFAGGLGKDGRSTNLYLGARKYLSDTGFDWFAGGGVGLSGFATEDREGDGVGFFGEFGMELFRLYSTHMTTFLRADLPAYQLEPFDAGRASWEVPLSLHVNLGW